MDARVRWLFLVVLAAVITAARPAPAFDHSHPAWNALLKSHVVLLDGGKASRLKYSAMAQERAALQDYLQGLSRVSEAEFRAWSRPEQMAFLINAYNAHTVEHEILRKQYPDPRIHYAVNCASIGCPMLREEAYVAVHLEKQLEEQTRRFLSDRSRNRVHGGRLEVSKIFDWFREDFEPFERYFAPHAQWLSDDPGQQKLVVDGKARLSFLDYDWSLNDSR
jgi:hypothetical protein